MDPIRPNRRCKPLSALLCGALLGGCTWVDISEQAEQVNVITAAEARDCVRVGNVSAETRAKVMGVERNKDRISDELLALARDEAAALGANAISPITDIVDGRQRFEAWRCP